MKILREFFVVFVLLMLIGGHSFLGATHLSDQETDKGETSLEVLFNRVLVYQKEGGTQGGLLVGIQHDSLILQVGTEDVKFPFKNLAKVVVMVEKKMGSYALTGMFVGMYLGSYLVLRDQVQNEAYAQDEMSAAGIALWNLLLSAVGGGVGLLAGSMIDKDEIEFVFGEDLEKRHKEWERLRNFVLGVDTSYKKVHLSVQGGKVFLRAWNQYKDQIGSGITGSVSREHEMWNFSSFNLMRSLRFTYSPLRWFDVGASVMWLGEPPWGKRIEASENRVGESHVIITKLDATGYYLIGVFKPFAGSMPRSISWELGVGLGAATIDFELEANWNKYDHRRDYSQWKDYRGSFGHANSEKVFSGTVFTTFNLFLHRGLSLGAYADYAYLPDRDAPAVPEVGFEAQKLRFGNASIGFSLGLHF